VGDGAGCTGHFGYLQDVTGASCNRFTFAGISLVKALAVALKHGCFS
jgi:hypothetical protein